MYQEAKKGVYAMCFKILPLILMIIASNVYGAEIEYKKEPAKAIFLRNITARPWWNNDYKLRIPILVSEPIGKERKKAVIDFEYKAGNELASESIRVITAEGEEVPSQIINKNGNKLEIIFLTDLRKYEQKPFLIYCNLYEPGKNFKHKSYDSDLNIKDTDKFYKISNDKIDVEFRRTTKRKGKINKIRIRGSESDNELSVLSSGGAWYGHSIIPSDGIWGYKFHRSNTKYSNAKLTVNGPLKKIIEYSDKDLTVKYTVYSFSDRIDYEFIPGEKKFCGTKTAWLVNGGSALDNIYYEGKKGIKKLHGERNEISDGLVYRGLKKWLKEGWIGIEDVSKDVTIGEFFDINALSRCDFLGQSMNAGENITLILSLKDPVRGALVAMQGDYRKLKNEYLDWKNPPEISVGKEQVFFETKIKVPDYLKDVTRGFLTAIHPLRDSTRHDDNSASELIKTIKRFGANSVKLRIYRRYIFPMSEERLQMQRADFKIKYAEQKGYLKDITSAAHSKGIAVRFWYGGKTKWQKRAPFKTSDLNDDLEDCLELAKAGVDYIKLQTGGEWHNKSYGSGDLTREKEYNRWTEFFSKQIKDKYPKIPIGILCSGSGSLSRYIDIEEKAPYLDTLETEIVVGARPNVTNIKYGVRYPLAVFGNDGRTAQHHFYYFQPKPSYVSANMEIPLMFGLKSFCHESLSNKLNNPELVGITVDFYRFIDHTGLENFIAKSKPLDFVGVLRDRKAFVNDILNEKFRSFPNIMSLYEARCKDISGMKNLPVNVIVNRYCSLKNLKRYKLIIMPSNPVLDDKLAEKLVQYVKAGGCLITEDQSVRNKIIAAASGLKMIRDYDYNCRQISSTLSRNKVKGPFYSTTEVKPIQAQVIARDARQQPAIFLNKCGKGKIIYSPYILSDSLSQNIEKARFVKSLICEAIGKSPVELSDYYDNRVETSLLTDGKEYLLGIYNPSHKPAELNLKLNIPVKPDWYTLDVKGSRRFKFDGQIKVTVPPISTGFYLIGGNELTRIPETKSVPIAGAGASIAGMKFLAGTASSFKLSDNSKNNAVGVFKPAKGKGKSGSQNYGAEAIYLCLKGSGVKVRFLNDLNEKTLADCYVVIVPNMGLEVPGNLDAKWFERIRSFVKAGGRVLLIHHSIGASVSPPVFPEIGAWNGSWSPKKTIEVVKKHQVTAGLKVGDIFKDMCWDFLEIQPDDDGIVLAKGIKDKGFSVPVLVVGEFGKGKVILSGIGIGAGYKSNSVKGKDIMVKVEQVPEGKLKQLLLNAVNWLRE